MIGQISPLVKVGNGNRVAVLHVAGGTIGGLTTGALLGIVPAGLAALGIAWPTPLVLLGVAVFILAVVLDTDLARTSKSVSIERQTPAVWACQLGGPGACFAWGIDLGLGWSTRIPSLNLVAVMVAAAAGPSLVVSAATMGIYGLLRTSVPAVLAACSMDASSVSTRLAQRADITRWLGVVASCFGGFVSSMVLVSAFAR
jgi:hypothetical protein